MKHRTLIVASLLFVAAVVHAQTPVGSPGERVRKPTATPTAAHTTLAPTVQAPAKLAGDAISADSAKSIALANVQGATVVSESLRMRKGNSYYLLSLRDPGSKSRIRATVDATTGTFTRLDRATKPDVAAKPHTKKP